MTSETDAAVKTEPWFFRREGCLVVNGAGHIIAKVSVTRVDDAGIQKRGRLAAAAPELRDAGVMALEAIDNILSAHRGQHEYAQLQDAFNALQAAIAKAEGRHV